VPGSQRVHPTRSPKFPEMATDCCQVRLQGCESSTVKVYVHNTSFLSWECRLILLLTSTEALPHEEPTTPPPCHPDDVWRVLVATRVVSPPANDVGHPPFLFFKCRAQISAVLLPPYPRHRGGVKIAALCNQGRVGTPQVPIPPRFRVMQSLILQHSTHPTL